ncbi:MAG: cytochrome b/b6 domain-containing protein [bacterium]|jgi:cytochrome b subunit of formate dehydrogenase|nr:cytochrome b/b6 domain-containing protein [bacterium]
MSRVPIPILLLALLLAGLARAQDTRFDPENCLYCHGKPWMAVLDSAGVRNFHIDENVHRESVHGRFACRQCHVDIDQVPHRTPVQKVNCAVACHVIDPYTGRDFSHLQMAQDLANSVHGKSGKGALDHRKPVCKDCHVNSIYWQKLPSNLERARNKCLACHENYNELEGDFKHLALHISESEYWRTQKNFEACIRCHTDNELVSDSLATLLIDGTMVSSFLKSFHGRGFSFGDRRSPVCADCHGYHKVLSHTDERSMIHSSNLRQTCSATGCHDGATVAFATAGSMHDLYQGVKVHVLVWVKRVYIWLIVLTIGGMMLHNLLDWWSWRRHRKAHAAAAAKAEQAGAVRRVFRRLTPAERISHVIMFVSFTLLALTGVILWIPPERFGTLTHWVYFMPVRDWSHRVAAIMLTLVSVYHVGYALFTRRGRALLGTMLPGPSDIRLFFHNLAFMLGRRKDRPPFGFFNYSEKMEYWAFAWGSLVMTATGIILWWEHLGSKFIVDLARLVHSLEAILAVAAIVVWHFWNVHWKPARWPMSEVWIDGRMGEEDMEEEHGALMAADAVTTHGSILMQEVTGTPERRRHTRKVLARTLGWSFLTLTILTCAAMVWSFRLYLGLGGRDSDTMVAQWLKRPLADKEAALADPTYPLRVAHEDVDWRHRRFHDQQPVVVEDSQLRRSECLLCHSLLPHQGNVKTRSYINLHSRFMSCEGCHAHPVDRQPSNWAWLDLRRNPAGQPDLPYKLLSEPAGTGLGNYTSLLGLKVDGAHLFADLDSERAREYLGGTAPMTQARMKETKDRFHDRIRAEPGSGAQCSECHAAEGGLLDYQALGFDEGRIRQLRSSAITASVTDNEIFYLPPAY